MYTLVKFRTTRRRWEGQ